MYTFPNHSIWPWAGESSLCEQTSELWGPSITRRTRPRSSVPKAWPQIGPLFFALSLGNFSLDRLNDASRWWASGRGLPETGRGERGRNYLIRYHLERKSPLASFGWGVPTWSTLNLLTNLAKEWIVEFFGMVMLGICSASGNGTVQWLSIECFNLVAIQIVVGKGFRLSV